MVFSNKVYDILKWIDMILLPGLGTLYVALAAIWHFPFADQISGTVTALVLFLGLLLGLSNVNYRVYIAGIPPAQPDERLKSVQRK